MKNVLFFFGVFIGLFLIVGLGFGIYEKATGVIVSDMTYGAIVWGALFSAIIATIIKVKMKKK
jgi:hypothetical protein